MKSHTESIQDILKKIAPHVRFEKNLVDQLSSLETVEVLIQLEIIFEVEFQLNEFDFTKFTSVANIERILESQLDSAKKRS